MTKPNPNQETLEEMLRVDHAGEYGANRIYEGQLMVLGKTAMAPTLKHMLEQEQEHLKKFDQLLNDNKVRPSALMPLWHVAGLALGIGSALLGKKAAMACTVAVEEAIEEHYNSQIELIKDEELKKTITKFRDEEVEHKDIAVTNQAREMKGYALFSNAIKLGAKASIFLAKKICIIAIIGLPFAAQAVGPIDEATTALKKGNNTAAYNIVKPLAATGNPDAQFMLCGMFYNAQGVPKNDFEAARWCHAAAQNGNTEAMYNLALLYQNGEGVGQNFVEARKWYSEAAERGHKDAEFNLAELSGKNKQTADMLAQQIAASPQPAPQPAQPEPQNTQALQMAAAMPQPVPNIPNPQLQMQAGQQIQAQAPILRPYQVAAQPLQPMPQQQIPQQQIPQQQIPQQFVQQPMIQQPLMQQQPVQVASLAPARVPAPKAVKAKHLQSVEPASGYIAPGIKVVEDVEAPIIIVENDTPVDPYSACIMAAQRGEVYDICNKDNSEKKPEAQQVAMLDSGMRQHSFGVVGDNNFSTALENAKKGDADAQNELGLMYRNGTGVAKNYGEAIKWLEKAASKGHVHAMMNLAEIYREGTGVAPNQQLAYSWYNLAADRSTSSEDKTAALTNVAELSKNLSNEEIGNALQYVTKLDERIPQYN